MGARHLAEEHGVSGGGGIHESRLRQIRKSPNDSDRGLRKALSSERNVRPAA